MPINGNAFLEFTEWLQRQTSCESEICSRCSINRAYYGAFHITKDFLIMDEKSGHRDVIRELKSRNEYLGNRLYDFFEERKDADYRLRYNFRRAKADRLVSEIKEFLEELGKT
ncbi:Uncharacterised protein [uncultured archaeon]|nr:Uncharacterised protein [uncultured archaeon]